MKELLVGLQGLQVAILLLHDWIPVPPLNDLPATRRAHTLRQIALGTLASSLLPALGLTFSVLYWNARFPGWLWGFLLFAYGFLFVGELEAWWVPFGFKAQPERAALYAGLYGNTHALLPARNGIRINTLHCVLRRDAGYGIFAVGAFRLSEVGLVGQPRICASGGVPLCA